MAWSNKTLSGCFESTFAIGFLIFLFVQAPRNSMLAARLRITNRFKTITSTYLGKEAANLFVSFERVRPFADWLPPLPSGVVLLASWDRLFRTPRCQRPGFPRPHGPHHP